MYFNPRPREEGDANLDIMGTTSKISIHALVKRATVPNLALPALPRHFNPRPREEGDAKKS